MLLELGLRLSWLGTPRLTWSTLDAVIRHAPPGNALSREVAPIHSEWTITDHLLAAAVNLLSIANWQRVGDEHAPRPKPLLPPGVTDPSAEGYGSGAIPLDQFDEWWNS